jgi:ligand-binding sensor domain-containing protein
MTWGCTTIFTLLSSICPAQPANNLQFNHFSAEHGLSQTVFTSIFQDRKGYMWFGSFTGLLKFDGYNFISFTPDPNKKKSIPDNAINKFCEDSAGNIWMVHDSYPVLTKYNPHSESFALYPYGDNNRSTGISGYVSDLVTDRQGKVWIGTDAGLFFYDEGSDKMINLSDIIYPDTLCNRNIHCLMIDHNGWLWIGTANGINIYDPVHKKLRLFNPPDKDHVIISKQVQFIMEDHSDNMWIRLSWTSALNRGVYRYNPSTGASKIYSHSATDPNSLSAGHVNTLMEDSHHTIWVCMYEGGLNAYQQATDNFIRYKADATDKYALNSNHVISLFEDRSGVFWIGSNGGGLSNCYLSNKKFSVYQNYEKDFISHYPLSLYKDHTGRIYMTTLGAGIYEFNPVTGNFRSYKLTSPNEEVTGFNSSHGMLDASDGTLWAVSYNEGLHKLNRQTGRLITVHSIKDNPDTTFHNLSNCIVEDLDKRLWIGTNYGLKCYNLRTKTFSDFEKLFRDTNRLSSDVIVDLYCDPDGILWITGTNGLTLFNTKTAQIKIFKHDDSNPHSISTNHLNYFYDDHNGKVWIGTEGGGLNEFDKKSEQFISFTTENGLPDNSIYGILNDDHGNLWLSTNKGLCKFTPPYVTNGKAVCRNYDMSDGLPGNEYNYKTCVKGNDGRLYFASTKGLVAFNPAELKDNQFIPPVVITDFSVFNKLILPNDSTGILKLPADETKQIKLSYK